MFTWSGKVAFCVHYLLPSASSDLLRHLRDSSGGKKKRFSVVHSVCQDGRQIVSGPQCGCDCYAQILPPHGVNGHCLRLNEQSGMERS